MKERPILFSAPMVRALLSGTKTQTRRVAKVARELSRAADRPVSTCPYGRKGDRLWVREAFALSLRDPTTEDPQPSDPSDWDPVIYRADDTTWNWTDGENKPIAPPWKPSSHMFRWMSRITLEITNVRVQRLQDISEGDAKAEGVPADASVTARENYACLWDSINGPGSWDANPWVWAISFKRSAP